MSGSFGAIAGAAIGAHPDETPSGRRPLRQRLLAGEEVETALIARIVNRPITEKPVLPVDAASIAGLAIGAAEDELGGALTEENLIVSDAVWCGRPDDIGAAHLEPDVRLLDAGVIQEEIPYLPWQQRRATTTLATLRLANGDRGLDLFFGRRTVDGQRVQLWLVEAWDGYFSDRIDIADALAVTLDPGLDEATAEIANVASLLEGPALSASYEGRGGSTGDARLTGKYVPVVYGAPFNVEPDLESAALQIDRWHVGALSALTVIRDNGAPLLWDGRDWPSYEALATASVAPGFYTTALSIGRSKRGATAVGVITGDPVTTTDTAALILLALARGPAALPDDLINAGSFGALPAAKLDLFLKGDRSITVAEIFDAVLRPWNGWYGSLTDRRLSVGIVGAPEAEASSFEIESADINENTLGLQKFDQPPVFRLAVSGRRNWRPLSADELVDFTQNPSLPQAMWERLQREEDVQEVSDLGVKQRHRAAYDAIERHGVIRGHFRESADALAAAQELFKMLKRPRRFISFETGLHEVETRAGAYGSLSIDALELQSGRPALCQRRSFSQAARSIGMRLLVATDTSR